MNSIIVSVLAKRIVPIYNESSFGSYVRLYLFYKMRATPIPDFVYTVSILQINYTL